MKLCGMELFGSIPQKITRKGNQFMRAKTLVTKSGNITATLQNDTVTIVGSNGQRARVLASDNPPEAAEFFFNNFEHFFDPKNNAMPDIIRAFSK